MEGSGSAWQNPFLVSGENQKIWPWEGAEPAPTASTGFGSGFSFMMGGKSFTIFTFFS